MRPDFDNEFAGQGPMQTVDGFYMSQIEMIIPARGADIGAFEVRRILPFRKRRSVGPFVFVDDFGPIEFVKGEMMDVLAHPHIGLATVTYLFEGRMTHRDSIGSVQVIEPGEVNWMTAGRGVVHSERSSDAGNKPGERLLGLQTWVALPAALELCEPDFSHNSRDLIPGGEFDGGRFKVILGSAFGSTSPVKTQGNPTYAECNLNAGSVLEIGRDIEERSIYVLEGGVKIGEHAISPFELAVITEGEAIEVRAAADSHFMLIGGDRLDIRRHMWWNFVATSKDLIEDAKLKWHRGEFDPIPNEKGFVPLPKGSFPEPQPL
jgi:redox-sensitive bicupin YhaK (pirin superfamily)